MDAIRKIEAAEPVAWIAPDWNAGTYTGSGSPVSTYELKGWEPLYAAQTLASKEAEIERLRGALQAVLDETGGYVANTSKSVWNNARAALTQPTE